MVRKYSSISSIRANRFEKARKVNLRKLTNKIIINYGKI